MTWAELCTAMNSLRHFEPALKAGQPATRFSDGTGIAVDRAQDHAPMNEYLISRLPVNGG